MKISAAVLASLFALLGFVAAPAPAQTVDPILQACIAPGQGGKLSSNGCECASAADCLGTCAAGGFCTGGPAVPGCAKKFNGAKASWNGCPCSTNGDCRGLCAVNVNGGTCINSIDTNDPPGPPVICPLAGLNGENAANGCPCNADTDCGGDCNLATRTCGGLVGAVANTPSTMGGIASDDTTVGGTVYDLGIVSGTKARPSSVRFQLYGPNDPLCLVPYGPPSTLPIDGLGLVNSEGVVVNQPGTYRFVARYLGNAWNLPAMSSCFQEVQQVTVLAVDLFFNGFE